MSELEYYIREQLRSALMRRLTCGRCQAVMTEDPHHEDETPVRLWCMLCGWSPGEVTTPKPAAEPRGILWADNEKRGLSIRQMGWKK